MNGTQFDAEAVNLNPANYSDPDVDELFRQAEQSFDTEEQNEHLRQVQSLAHQDRSNFVPIHDDNRRAISPAVQGFIPAQAWFLDLTGIWMED